MSGGWRTGRSSSPTCPDDLSPQRAQSACRPLPVWRGLRLTFVLVPTYEKLEVRSRGERNQQCEHLHQRFPSEAIFVVLIDPVEHAAIDAGADAFVLAEVGVGTAGSAIHSTADP